MGTRKAPTGARHARCVHHERYDAAPAGWLCFSDEAAPTDEIIIERMEWLDILEASRAAYRAAWAHRLEPDGLSIHQVAYCAHGTRITGVDCDREHVNHGPMTWADERYTAPVGQASDFRGGIPASRFAGYREAVAA